RTIVLRALEDPERGLGGQGLRIDDSALDLLVNLANGDARFALNTLEMASVGAEDGVIGRAQVAEAAYQRAGVYDRAGDAHFDTISALHKSIRGSDPDAALYWMARMLERGDDPLYVARRLVRTASEDIGLADPQALTVAVAAQQAVHFLGMPEGALALAEAAVYLATAPKSNALYRAYGAAAEDVRRKIGRASCRARESISGVAVSSRRRHTRFSRDWSSDVCSSDLGHRFGGPTGAHRGGGGAAGRALPRHAGGRAGARRGGGLPGYRAEEQRAVSCLRRGGRGRAPHAERAGADPSAQRTHTADEGARLRGGVPLRARLRRGDRRAAAPAGQPGGSAL